VGVRGLYEDVSLNWGREESESLTWTALVL
jgi:hypothetical protein